MNSICVNNSNLDVKEFNGQRVVTFKDIDLVHSRIDGTARRNFYENKKHFIENIDYYLVTVENSKCTKFVHLNIPPKGLYLFTESGYLMLVKSFTDDLAWEVQRQLVNIYFKSKQIPKDRSNYEITNKTYKHVPVKREDISSLFFCKKFKKYLTYAIA